ncbi:MAG: glycoside hydrolase family 27 protein [Clostridia bacterium]|nr:glycoside hydrolase family 27 protein [Clostridia bacterium]
MLQHTPPMGWNTWNTFGLLINEQLILESAKTMIDTGLCEAGYNYIVIDDGWQLPQRDENGRLVADPEKFPRGIRALADDLHAMGLKLGIYSCAGHLTCGGYPGSNSYEFEDAETFAEWHIDFLKYDYCYKPQREPGDQLYLRMATALANCGRDILLSACSWGADDTALWIKSTGAHCWRSTVDINDSWESICRLAKEQKELQKYNGLGCFNDMDMLVVGMNGQGNVGLGGCSYIQYRTHFSLWAFLGSPLMIGCDIRSMTPETAAILKNRELIAINQDPAYRQPFSIGGSFNFECGDNAESFVWAKLLENGDFAIGCFNFSDSPRNMYFTLSDLSLARFCGRKLVMTDLWTGETCETVDARFMTKVDACDCRVYRAKIVKE